MLFYEDAIVGHRNVSIIDNQQVPEGTPVSQIGEQRSEPEDCSALKELDGGIIIPETNGTVIFT